MNARITERLSSLDVHRGFLMIVMAIDHASFFIARVHSAEFWGTALPVYPDLLWFFTRWVTHLCAPGFFFLMGTGMTLLADSRQRAGWSQDRITRLLVVRGLLLVLFQLAIEDPAWMAGSAAGYKGAAIYRGGPVPGGGTEGMIYLGVLFALGGSMVFWSFMRRVSPWLTGLICAAAIMVTQWIIPGPEKSTTIFSPVMTLLFIPAHSNMIVVFYPLIPWLGVTGLGLLYGKLLQRSARAARRTALWSGVLLVAFFTVIRATGFGDLNVKADGWMGFLNVVKYPPSLAFLSVTLGFNLILMALWAWAAPCLKIPTGPLIIFGRTALFFYLVHLWIYMILGLFFRDGSGLAAMYAVWQYRSFAGRFLCSPRSRPGLSNP